MIHYKGINLLPRIKTTELKKYNAFSKLLIKSLVWLFIIVLVDVLSYIPVSLQKVKLVKLQNQEKQLISTLKAEQPKYILYHNIAFRLQIVKTLQKTRLYVHRLVNIIDQTVSPSVATQYTIHKNGDVTIGLVTDDFIKASVSWHKLLMTKNMFIKLNLSNFTLQNNKVPLILKGKLNLKELQQNAT